MGTPCRSRHPEDISCSVARAVPTARPAGGPPRMKRDDLGENENVDQVGFVPLASMTTDQRWLRFFCVAVQFLKEGCD